MVLIIVRNFTHKRRCVVFSHELTVGKPVAARRIVGVYTNGIAILPCVVDGTCLHSTWCNGGVDAEVGCLGAVGHNHRTATTGQVNLIDDVLVTGREEHSSESKH